MTQLQRKAMVAVLKATIAGRWTRAGECGIGSSQGERVTLASLYAKGLLKRQAWSGQEGEANAAYEYQASDLFMETARESLPELFGGTP